MSPYNFHLYTILDRASTLNLGTYVYFLDAEKAPRQRKDLEGRFLVKREDFLKALDSNEKVTNYYSNFICNKIWLPKYKISKSHNNNKIALEVFGRNIITEKEGIFFHKSNLKIRYEGKEYLIEPSYIPNLASFKSFDEFVIAGKVVTALKEVKSGTLRGI